MLLVDSQAGYEKYFGALEILLTKNLLTIALNNIGNVAAAALLFDKSIISRQTSNIGIDPGNRQPEPVK